MATENKGFTTRYFSDGTYEATYDEAKEGTAPIKGTWDTSDGFSFAVDKSKPRTNVGKVYFSAPSKDGPSWWEGEMPAPEPVHHADGNWSQVGPAQFRGNHYTGAPGGRLQAAEFTIDPNSLNG